MRLARLQKEKKKGFRMGCGPKTNRKEKKWTAPILDSTWEACAGNKEKARWLIWPAGTKSRTGLCAQRAKERGLLCWKIKRSSLIKSEMEKNPPTFLPLIWNRKRTCTEGERRPDDGCSRWIPSPLSKRCQPSDQDGCSRWIPSPLSKPLWPSDEETMP